MKHRNQTANQITEGVSLRQLLLFFFPIVLGTFFRQFYNTIDTVIVGSVRKSRTGEYRRICEPDH